MAHILSTKTRPKVTQTRTTGDDGVEREAEKIVNLVQEVTFMLDRFTPHTLTFHPEGTIVSTDSEPRVRTVGEEVPALEYLDAAEAVTDFLDGKV
jgi:hypothetical protein